MVGRSLHRVHRAWMAVAIGLSLVAAIAAPAGAALPSPQPAQEDTPVEIPARVERQVERTGEATFWIRLDGKADLSAAAGIDRLGRARPVRLRDVDQLRRRRPGRGPEQAGHPRGRLPRVLDQQHDPRHRQRQRAHHDGRPSRRERDRRAQVVRAPRADSRSEGEIQVTEWGLDAINAPDVWADFGVRGEGIVVANIDTGVQFDHPALVDHYRGTDANGNFDHNYNWFDPSLRLRIAVR